LANSRNWIFDAWKPKSLWVHFQTESQRNEKVNFK
jgi:hypothetical protein